MTKAELEVARYNFSADEEGEKVYRTFVRWAIEDFDDEHECPDGGAE